MNAQGLFRWQAVSRYICMGLVWGACMVARAALGATELPADTTAKVKQAEEAGQWDEVISTYKEYMTKNPAAAALWVRVAEIENNRGNHDQALTAWEEASRAMPGDATLHAKLSQSYAVAKRPADALKSLDRALALDPENTTYLISRAELANWVGRPDLAAESLEKVLQLEPERADAMLLLARSRNWNGELDASARVYDEYVDKHPDQAEACIEYGRVEIWRGNFEHARKLIDQYEKLTGNKAQADKDRARLYASANKPKKSLALNEPLLDKAAFDFELNAAQLIALHNANQPRDVAEQMDKLQRIRPESEEVKGFRDYVETPQRPSIDGSMRYYWDRDDLRILQTTVSGGVPLLPETRLLVGAEFDKLRADVGSGLENIDGTADADYRKMWMGAHQIILPELWLDVQLGAAEVVDVDEELVYVAGVGTRPFDSLNIKLAQERDFVLISPRSATVPVTRDTTKLDAQWEPGLLYTIVASGRYDDLSDGNERWEVVLAPRRAFVRNEWLNLDLGLRGLGNGYSEDLDSGYYDPEDYRQLAATAFAYFKIAPEVGASVMGSAGYYKDNTMDAYEPGWSLDADLTAGTMSDWMFKCAGSAFESFRALSSGPNSFRAFAVSVSLMRRF